jgi:hypothetical protein
MVFENGVKNIQAAAYNGACTVHIFFYITIRDEVDILCWSSFFSKTVGSIS